MFRFFSSPEPNRYEINTHRLVKIWLSPKTEVFLNPENKARLETTKRENPEAHITLVYDSRLLAEDAHTALKQYCNDIRVSPFNMNDLDTLQLNDIERKLITLYQIEIETPQEQGGNLGAASDMLRTLSVIRKMGIYTDFDVAVNTSGLPEKISLGNTPLLLPVNFKIRSPIRVRIHLNIDVLLVADHPDSDRLFSQIQTKIIESYDTSGSSLFYNDFGGTPIQVRKHHMGSNKARETGAIIESLRCSTGSETYYRVLRNKPSTWMQWFSSFWSEEYILMAFSIHDNPRLARCFRSPSLDQGMYPKNDIPGDASYTPYGQHEQEAREAASFSLP